jgi:NADPH-dependent 2,4-dienoyl-CoA reductase/sulfur reductase-like enzyme
MIVIAGAGPAGIAAALAATKRGAAVTVIDDNPAPGGQIWRGAYRFPAAPIRFIANARIVWGSPTEQTLLVETPEKSIEIPYDKLILATGARELFLPFPGWTLPCIAGVGGLQALAKGGFPLGRKRIAVAGSGPLLLAAAAYFRKAGADVVLIAEQATHAAVAKFGRELILHPAKFVQAGALQIDLLGIPYRLGCHVERAEGNGRLTKLWFRSGSRTFSEDVDLAAIAWGLCPNTELAELMGCEIKAAVAVDDLQRTSQPFIYCAGESTGIGGVDLATLEGAIAGSAAAGDEDAARQLFTERDKARRFAHALNTAFAPRPALRALPDVDTIVCRCEDVTFEKLQTVRSFREAKLHTRCGMGPCQGRVCGTATQFLFGWRTESIRPPVLPSRTETLICSSPNSTG